MSASLILDIVLLLIALFIIIKYTIEGFLKSVLNFARLILSVIFAIALRNPVAELFNKWFMKGAVANWVNSSVLKHLASENPPIDFIEIYKQNPVFYTKVLSKFGLDLDALENQIGDLSQDTAATVSETIANSIATMLSTILAVIAVFVVSMIVLTLVFKLLNCITKISGIK